MLAPSSLMRGGGGGEGGVYVCLPMVYLPEAVMHVFYKFFWRPFGHNEGSGDSLYPAFYSEEVPLQPRSQRSSTTAGQLAGLGFGARACRALSGILQLFVLICSRTLRSK